MHPSIFPVEFIVYTKSDCLIHYLPIIYRPSIGFRVLKVDSSLRWNDSNGVRAFRPPPLPKILRPSSEGLRMTM
jgi:hypothetical protein